MQFFVVDCPYDAVLDRWTENYYCDPIIKRISPNPVLCPQGHVNELGIMIFLFGLWLFISELLANHHG